MGALLIPNTVALVAGAPHPAAGKALIDFLLSPQVEARLAVSGSVQMPLRASVATPAGFVAIDQIETMDVDYQKMAAGMTDALKFVQNLFSD